jgi:hypothetical protein
MKTHKDEKIQVLLSSTDHHKLKNIILQHAINNGKLVTVSSYVRELILNHIKDYEGEQTSFANEEIKKLLYKNKTDKNG